MFDNKEDIANLLEGVQPIITAAVEAYGKAKRMTTYIEKDEARQYSSEFVIMHMVGETRDLLATANEIMALAPPSAQELMIAVQHVAGATIVLDMLSRLREPKRPSITIAAFGRSSERQGKGPPAAGGTPIRGEGGADEGGPQPGGFGI